MEFERLARLGEQVGTPTLDEPSADFPPRDPFPEIAEPPASTRLLETWRVLALPLVLGVACRLILIPLTSWSKDDSIWWLASANGMQHLALYQRIGFSYPPVWGDLLQGVGWFLQHLGFSTTDIGHSNLQLEGLAGSNAFSVIVTSPLFNWCFKGILFLFDLGTGLLLYEVVRRTTNERRARSAFCLWFLNPFVIFESSVFGAFDIIVAFTILAAIVLFLSSRYVWAGIALGLAIMTKGSPAFLVPLFVLVAFDRGGDTVESRLRSAAPFVGGLSACIVLLMLPVLATGQLHAMLTGLFGRTSSSPPGGYSIFGILGFRGLNGLSSALTNWGGLGRLVLALQLVLAVLLGLVGMRQARRDLAFSLVAMVGLVMVVVVILGPIANAQYALWFLPELITLAVLWRRAMWSVISFSIAALASAITLYGPSALLFPLMDHVVSPAAVTNDVTSWTTMSQLPWSSGPGGTNFRGPITVLALTGLYSLLKAVLWTPTPRRQRLVALFGTTNGGVVPAMAVILVVAVSGTALTGAAGASGAGASVALTATSAAQGTEVTATVRASASLQDLRLASFPTLTTNVPTEVDIFVDPSYPVLGTTPVAVHNIANGLTNELHLHGYRGTVRSVDADQLRTLLLDQGAARHTALVDMSGVLPLEVFSAHQDLVSPWLHAGGTIYWSGAVIGAFSASPGDAGDPSTFHGSLGPTGVGRFLDPTRVSTVLANPFSVGTVPASPARAFQLRYQFNFQAPVTVPPLPDMTRFGWSAQKRSSITRVSEGVGELMLFGGTNYAQGLIVPDLELMITSGMAWSNGPFSSVSVPQGIVERGGKVKWRVPDAPSPQRTVVIAFDPSDAGLVFVRTVASTG